MKIRARQINPIDWELVEELMDEDPPQNEWPLPENAEEIRTELGIQTLSVDYVVPGEGIPEAQGGASVDGNGGAVVNNDSGGGEASSGSAASEAVAPGLYAGPPFGGGGSGCSLGAGSSSTGLLSVAFMLAGLLGLRRRR